MILCTLVLSSTIMLPTRKEEVSASQQANKSMFEVMSRARVANLDIDIQIDLVDSLTSTAAWDRSLGCLRMYYGKNSAG